MSRSWEEEGSSKESPESDTSEPVVPTALDVVIGRFLQDFTARPITPEGPEPGSPEYFALHPEIKYWA